MAERTIVVDGLTLNYEGIFSVADLFQVIENWLREKGYDKRETRNQEHVKPSGRYIELLLEPWKKVSDYARLVIKMEIYMHDITDVDVEKDGRTLRLNNGKLSIVFFGFLETDYELRWEARPFYVFTRTFFDKLFYRAYTKEYTSLLASSIYELHTFIRTHLNMYKV
ncbi:hypothetical protein COT48_03610 [Candidatus Woesearchaeota archaeon CG08_land_8_20_14_0_20_47_9]|nr:MAG: hypothetical protein AUJ69_01140 [Candidatus Woesearchaeota archaeon CG1_02_47_18]PIN72265.1 MAG: hypothetical protein COV22_03685 [Candidatus Woesearchaeota archaeon CG10_big_fil_rev_8_21_14_0_10_47_5]PIO03765.1 MAG: hypothetical protein COT48_03610 [Candidatus Woesearchaeota archaeon CG08_land_8_20_14_0_20_47_9]HII29939.1 hypothetical protein [Candidatus Woesearchaeota archaeon]